MCVTHRQSKWHGRKNERKKGTSVLGQGFLYLKAEAVRAAAAAADTVVLAHSNTLGIRSGLT